MWQKLLFQKADYLWNMSDCDPELSKRTSACSLRPRGECEYFWSLLKMLYHPQCAISAENPVKRGKALISLFILLACVFFHLLEMSSSACRGWGAPLRELRCLNLPTIFSGSHKTWVELIVSLGRLLQWAPLPQKCLKAEVSENSWVSSVLPLNSALV